MLIYTLLYLPGTWLLMSFAGYWTRLAVGAPSPITPAWKWSVFILALSQALLLAANTSPPSIHDAEKVMSPSGERMAAVSESITELGDYPYSKRIVLDLNPNSFLRRPQLAAVVLNRMDEVSLLWLSDTDLQIEVLHNEDDKEPEGLMCFHRQVGPVRIQVVPPQSIPDCSDPAAVTEFWRAQ